ncbi:MAG: hypothetical protein JW725_03770 [Candidatus Babeliaceae bacterium]|nr:hypothetical protein [Candidatus Babeliaceae bacterium]
MNGTIAIIGTGRVGATVAYTLIIKNLFSRLILVDSNTERCEGEMRDLADALAFSETTHIVQGSIPDARAADIIIITAGHAQKDPGESRLELYEKNRTIIENIFKQLAPLSPETLVLVVTNPLDLMTLTALKSSGLPNTNVFGTGTWLDTQRLRRYLGYELDVAPESIDAFVIGEHGDHQCVAWSQAHAGGVSIKNLGIDQQTLDTIAQKTAVEVYSIIKLKCATFYGIAACAADICETIIFDQKRIIPVSCWNPELEICLSIPVVLGKKGIERHIIMQLSEKERTQLRTSAERLKKMIKRA